MAGYGYGGSRGGRPPWGCLAPLIAIMLWALLIGSGFTHTVFGWPG